MNFIDMASLPPTSTPPPPAYCEFEDNSCCPRYSCSIRLSSHALIKHEFDTPFITSLHRSWQRANLDLCGTKLQVDAFDKRGICLKLSLQGADVGLALDYYRRSNVIRVRAEGRQFLVALSSRESCLEWINGIDAAIAISMPLDQRDEPFVATVPRKRAKLPAHAMGDDFWCRWREQWRRSGGQQVWLKGEPLHDGHERSDGHEHTLIGRLTHPQFRPSTCLAIGGSHRIGQTQPSSPLTSDGTSDASSSLSLQDSHSSFEQHHDRRNHDIDFDLACRKAMLEDASGSAHHDSASEAELAYATKCARALAYNARWKCAWYYRNGRKFSVRELIDEAMARPPCVYL